MTDFRLFLRSAVLAGAAVGGLAACSPAAQAPAEQNGKPATMEDMSKPSKGAAATERIGSGAGTILSLGEEGDFITIDHGPIGDMMGAMTMGFELVSDVELSGFAEGDEVAFTVKQGRDGTYRVISICKPAEQGPDCLQETPAK